MPSFIEELERFRRLLRIRHGLVMPDIMMANRTEIQRSILNHLGQYRKVLVVADQASIKAAGYLLQGLLPDSVNLFYQLFEAPAKPDMVNVHHVLNIAREMPCDALVAIGSGSISDICKMAAHELARPLYLIPTAASMNGYTSITASIRHDGLKQSFHTFLAKAIWVDPDIITHAPERLTYAGRADALAAQSAMLDWKLSHLVLESAYEEVLERCAMPRGNLMETLLLQGLGMTYAGASSPASGAEHMLAHCVEMMRPDLCEELLHGEMIAHCLPITVALQTKLLASDTPATLVPSADEPMLAAAFGSQWGAVREAYTIKSRTLDAIREETNLRIAANWISIKTALTPFLLDDASLSPLISVPRNPDIVVACRQWLPFTRFTRNRFTCLDLALQ